MGHFTVRFTKIFISGNLKGLSIDASLSFATYSAAAEYVDFCNAHMIKPVRAYKSSAYTCHHATIETNWGLSL